MSNYYNRQWRLPNNENKDKQSNYSMDFSVDQVIVLNQSLDLGTNNTVSFWIKGDSSGLNGSLFGKSGTDYFITMFPSAVYYKIGGNYGSGFSNTYTAIVDDNWHNVVFVRSGDSVSSYVDGSFIETNTGYGTTTSTTFNTIGNKENLAGDIVGQFDAVSCFNYALSSSQITTLYGSSSTGIGNPMSLSPKPVAYYPLGDQDAFNGSNYLVPNSSLKDYVFSFDGLAEITTGGISGISSNTTVSFWFNNSTAAGGQAPLIASLNYTSTTYENFAFRLQTTNILQAVLAKSGNYEVLQTSAIIDNAWYFVALTTSTSGSSVTATLYLNGTQVATNSGTDFSNLNDLQNGLTIGHWTASGNQNNFNGNISNVQIFNTALPATGSNSVETLYNNGSPLTSMSGFTSLQGWWKLDASATYDSSTGNWTIPDDSSNSNDGTSSGMTQANLVQSDLSFTSGYSPYALDFDGTNDYIDCGNDSSLTLTSDLSLSAWVKVSSHVNYAGIISKLQTGGAYNGYQITNGGSSGSVRFYTGANGGVDITATGLSTGVWYHICGVINHSSSVATLYVNGASVGTDTSFNAQSTVSNSLKIGQDNNAHYFEGSISNVSVWNAALTSSQVTEIYNEGVPSNLNNHSAYSNLVSWWQLGSNSSFNTNWTVLDEKGSNNGTSVNMTEDDIVDGVGSYANGTSSGMGGDEVIGDAPYSTANALSVNMDIADRVEDTPS